MILYRDDGDAQGLHGDRPPSANIAVTARPGRTAPWPGPPAAASADVPVVVMIDDADWLDEDLAVTLIEIRTAPPRRPGWSGARLDFAQ